MQMTTTTSRVNGLSWYN